MLTQYMFIKQVEINCVYQSNMNSILSKLNESCCINLINKLKSFDMIIKLIGLKLMSNIFHLI